MDGGVVSGKVMYAACWPAMLTWTLAAPNPTHWDPCGRCALASCETRRMAGCTSAAHCHDGQAWVSTTPCTRQGLWACLHAPAGHTGLAAPGQRAARAPGVGQRAAAPLRDPRPCCGAQACCRPRRKRSGRRTTPARSSAPSGSWPATPAGWRAAWRPSRRRRWAGACCSTRSSGPRPARLLARPWPCQPVWSHDAAVCRRSGASVKGWTRGSVPR